MLMCFLCSTMMVTHVSFVQDGEAYVYLLKPLVPEHSPEATLDTKDPSEGKTDTLTSGEVGL
jgi:hypothetical protein